jgi:hypothetical protein
MMVAMPMPPPMHSVMRPVASPSRSSSSSAGAEQHRARRAERVAQGDGAAVHVDAAWSTPSLRMKVMGTVAKASLTSKRSMSLAFMPAFASALRDAGMPARPA